MLDIIYISIVLLVLLTYGDEAARADDPPVHQSRQPPGLAPRAPAVPAVEAVEAAVLTAACDQ